MKTYVGSVISNLSNDSSSVAPTVMLNTCTSHTGYPALYSYQVCCWYGMLLLVTCVVPVVHTCMCGHMYVYVVVM